MEPMTLAGHLSVSAFHNDVVVYGPYSRDGGESTAVRVVLRNGYGITLGSGWYKEDQYPEVAPIKSESRDAMERDDFEYAWDAHPDFGETRDGERGCDVNRALAILTHLKGL